MLLIKFFLIQFTYKRNYIMHKLDGDKISTQNKHTKASSGVTDISQYEVRENKTRNQ